MKGTLIHGIVHEIVYHTMCILFQVSHMSWQFLILPFKVCILLCLLSSLAAGVTVYDHQDGVPHRED